MYHKKKKKEEIFLKKNKNKTTQLKAVIHFDKVPKYLKLVIFQMEKRWLMKRSTLYATSVGYSTWFI